MIESTGGMDSSGSVRVIMDKHSRDKKKISLEEEIMDLGSIEGGQYCAWRMYLFGLLIILTGGLLFLLSYWFQKKKFRVLYTPCAIERAEILLVTGWDGYFEVVKVEPFSVIPYRRQNRKEKKKFKIADIPLENRMFVFKHIRYHYSNDEKTFIPLLDNQTLYELYQRGDSFTPLTSEQHNMVQTKTGRNLIDIPVPPPHILLTREVLHPFFIFQIYSVIVWSTEAYYYYSAIIFLMALITATTGFYEVRSNLINIKKLSHFESNVNVIRDGETRQVSSIDLVVGDIVEISPFSTAPYMAVVTGSCVVDESMLTGESTPVLKVALPSQVNPRVIDPRYMVYGGTKVSEVRVAKGSVALGVVTTSGFQTSKGLLVLSILFPKPAHFKFVKESLKFLLALLLLAFLGFGVIVWRLVLLDTDAGTIVQRGCDLITVVVPPALPMAAGVGTAFAVGRLKKYKIFCVSLPRINMAGKINRMCFDKTGTLTEEGLDFMCVVPAREQQFEEPTAHVEDGNPLKMGMISCHSLTHIANVVSGDTLELKVFNSTKATLEEPHVTPDFDNMYISIVKTDKLSYGVLSQFEFMPKLQRMSVLVRDLKDASNTSYIITKGSPEMIYSLSRKETVPNSFWEVLRGYTHQGYRVLGIGYKPWLATIPPDADKNAIRIEAESELIFLGFIVLQNKLKPETTPIIHELKRASVRPVMITGDNILTAISIGKSCGIVDQDSKSDKEGAVDVITIRQVDNEEIEFDPSTLRLLDSGPTPKFEFAVTGKAFEKKLDILLADRKNGTGKYPFDLIITAGSIWARMSPENKSTLVEELMALGWYVGMCGDGANDCMALRSAHVGVSLSQAEASVSAPFTSQVTNISCIPKLFREGRSALTTAFQLFRFMALYSIIQFTNVVLLNFNATFLGNWMYLYQDLWVVFPLVILMGRSKSSKSLSRKRPSGRLFSPHNLMSIILHILITVAFQIGLYIRTQRQFWYYEVSNDNNDPLETNSTIFECTTLWIYAEFQYSCLALLFTMERKFKQPIYSNWGFMSWWFIVTVCAFLLLFVTNDIMFAFFQILYIPFIWRIEMFWLAAINCVLYVFVEVICGIAKEKGAFSKGRKMKKHKIVLKEYQALWSKRVKGMDIE